MDNVLSLEGQGNNKGLFDIVYQPYWGTQRALLYLHNGIDKIDLELNKKR